MLDTLSCQKSYTSYTVICIIALPEKWQNVIDWNDKYMA